MEQNHRLFNSAVIVSALGYFVDIFDILLFSLVRKSSLSSLGYSPEECVSLGENLISIQMIGLLIGGITFGILGDKKGRLKVLFASIIIYSTANLLNAFVSSYEQYALLRFIAGFGLAGELGAGITLVSELLPAKKRALASALIGAFGLVGALFTLVITHFFAWRESFFIGGIMGIILLIARLKVNESSLFKQIQNTPTSKGNLLLIFKNKKRLLTYIQCILIGLMSWYVIGLLVSFADQFGMNFGLENATAYYAVLFTYLGLILGDLSSVPLSNFLKSRKKAILFYYLLYIITINVYFHTKGGGSLQTFYLLYFVMGFSIGYSIITVLMSAELFGTNLRATAAISIPNMIRGSVPLTLFCFQELRASINSYVHAGWIIGIVAFIIGIIALIPLKESYNADLEFIEK